MTRHRRWPLVAVLVFVVVNVPATDWSFSTADAIDDPAGRVMTATWSSTADDGSPRAFTSTSLVIGAGAAVRLIERPVADKERAPKVAAVMAASGAVAAMNAGYFTKDHAPAGLLIVDGREVSPRSAETPLSGILAVDAAGRLSLRPRDDALDGTARPRHVRTEDWRPRP